MKILALITVLLLTGVASAQTYQERIDTLERIAREQRDALVAAQTETREARTAAELARTENIAQNQAFKGTLDAKDAFIDKQAKTLNHPVVKIALFLWSIVKWLAIGTILLYVFPIFASRAPVHSWLFQTAKHLLLALPVSQFSERFTPTEMVKAVTTPVVEEPAIVVPPKSDPAVAERLAAMSAPVAAPTPPAKSVAKTATDYTFNVDGFRTPKAKGV